MNVHLPCPFGCTWVETCDQCHTGYYRVSSDLAIAQKEAGSNDRCMACGGHGEILEKVVDLEDEPDWSCGVLYKSGEPHLFKSHDALTEWVVSVWEQYWEQHNEVKA
jgi:hypothetical protein